MESIHDDKEELFYSLKDTFKFLKASANLVQPIVNGLDIPLRAINTLGPDSTSSHLTVKFLLQGVASKPEIVLHDTFEAILKVAGHTQCNELAIVPSAFRGVDAFFMSENCEFLGCFFNSTPSYHFAWKPGENPFGNESAIKIATHPAPIGIIHRLLRHRTNWELVEAPSTVAAAKKALSGECQVAFCNHITARKLGLVISRIGEPIKMSWNIFLMKDTTSASWNQLNQMKSSRRNEAFYRA